MITLREVVTTTKLFEDRGYLKISTSFRCGNRMGGKIVPVKKLKEDNYVSEM